MTTGGFQMSNAPWILGIASSHNGGACLIHGTEIVAAIQEERLLRKKRATHPGAFPSLAIAYCLEVAHITPRQLDSVVLCASTSVKKEREDVYLNPQLQIARNGIKLHTIPHHLGHAIAVYALSGMDTTNILIIDGSGSPWDELPQNEADVIVPGSFWSANRPGHEVPREIISLYSGSHGVLHPIEKQVSSYPQLREANSSGLLEFQSLGDMFGYVGYQIFGSFYDGPGKVMGLAPYGKPTIPADEFYRIRDGRLDFNCLVRKRFQHNERWPNHKQEYEDLAASVQNALEEGVLYLCRRFAAGSNLCYAGGVALNSVANEKIVREADFASLFIMPAAEDSGTAIGAAYYGLWQLSGYAVVPEQRLDNLGRSYSSADIAATIDHTPALQARRPEKLIEDVADLLTQGKIVGWFQGGAELGPRALGQRSILCDPRNADMKDVLNSRVKFREGFRPFAPMIREENVCDWFDVEPSHARSPFMLRVMPFKESKKHVVPAVVHVDGTGRVQTVSKETAPLLHRLLTLFYEKTSVPILLNTSFNVAGEPIVETPRDALSCFLFTGMDYCVLGDTLVSKPDGFDAVFDHPLSLLSRWVTLSGDSDNADVHFEIPPLDPTQQFVESVHSSRAEELDLLIHRQRQPRLRVITRTPWGRVVHSLPGAAARIFQLVDGRRTGKDIYIHLLAAGQGNGNSGAYSLAQFRKELAMLWRTGAVWFQSKRESAALTARKSA